MNRETLLKTAGVIATIIGGGLLYLSGSGEELALEIVGGVFLLAVVIKNALQK